MSDIVELLLQQTQTVGGMTSDRVLMARAAHTIEELRAALASHENPRVYDHQARSFFKTIEGMKVQLAGEPDSPACEVSVRQDTWQLHLNTGAFFVKLELIEGGLLRDAQGRLWDLFGREDSPAPSTREDSAS